VRKTAKKCGKAREKFAKMLAISIEIAYNNGRLFKRADILI